MSRYIRCSPTTLQLALQLQQQQQQQQQHVEVGFCHHAVAFRLRPTGLFPNCNNCSNVQHLENIDVAINFENEAARSTCGILQQSPQSFNL